MSNNQQDVLQYFTSPPLPEFDITTHNWQQQPALPRNPALYDIPVLISKHPRAPQINEASPSLIAQVINEATSTSPALYSAEVASYIRQLGITSLWFFTTVILAHNGPYNLVNDRLHLDMCNFRQSPYWRSPGSRTAAFIPRGHLKTTIFTQAGIVQDLLRNPDERHLLVSATADQAIDILSMIKQPFASNDFFQALYPEYIPKGKEPWKQRFIVLPNRTRYLKDPSVNTMGVTSAAEGAHADALTFDDPVGLDEIDNNRGSNEAMRRARAFFITADPALLQTKRASRIGFIGTRWAIDDIAEIPVANAARFHGHQDRDFSPGGDRKWHVYYRQCVEEGSPIYPENFSNGDFESMARADWWNFVTQYLNKPQASGIVEFSDYDLKQASLEVRNSNYYISYEDDPLAMALGNCDVVLSLDPAGTERNIKAKTSRSSMGVWALDSHGRYTRIWARVGYYDVVSMINYLFEAHRQFPGYIRTTIVETNAMQKILLPIIRREEARRQVSIRPRGIPATGDKKARIRNALSLPLERGLVYAVDGAHTWMAFNEEMKLFPASDTRIDVLDESEKAFSALRKPPTEEERFLDDLEQEESTVLAELSQYGGNPVGY